MPDANRFKPHQIKSRDRVRDLAEVLTNEREVNAMLDLIDKAEWERNPMKKAGTGRSARKIALSAEIDSTILEPACGTGNFLVEVLRRKLATVTSLYGPRGACRPRQSRQNFSQTDGHRFEYQTLRAVASIYGIDIDKENVLETRNRLRDIIFEHLRVTLADAEPPLTPSDGIDRAVSRILDSNIILGDSINGSADIRITQYHYPVDFKYQVTRWTLKEIEARSSGAANRANHPPSRILHYLADPP